MTQEISYPTELTYWIAFDTVPDDNVAYGETSPEQVTTTGKLHIWTTLDKVEWESKLLADFGITVYPPEETPV